MKESSQQDTYYVVQKHGRLMDATIRKSLLEANGVECFMSDTSFVNLFPGGALSEADFELRVRIEDKQKAIDILRAKFNEKDLENNY